MTTGTRYRIIEYVSSKGRVTAKELAEYLGITRQALYLQLAKLLEINKLAKVGKPPRVYYFVPPKLEKKQAVVLEKKLTNFINERYLYVSPLGEKIAGVDGFVQWCHKTHQDVAKTAREYILTQKKYDKWMKDGVISGLKKLKSTFEKVYLDQLYYLDFYSIERFGKTKLGQLLLYAKQSQSKEIVAELAEEVKEKVEKFVRQHAIESVAYIPPTVKREVQLMRELERKLSLPLRKIKIVKVKAPLMVPQKTLAKLDDRIENAARTMVIEGHEKHKNLLLIDDAVGSGATLNETVKQIRERGMVSGKIIGLAIVGSYKGFDVISEV